MCWSSRRLVSRSRNSQPSLPSEATEVDLPCGQVDHPRLDVLWLRTAHRLDYVDIGRASPALPAGGVTGSAPEYLGQIRAHCYPDLRVGITSDARRPPPMMFSTRSEYGVRVMIQLAPPRRRARYP